MARPGSAEARPARTEDAGQAQAVALAGLRTVAPVTVRYGCCGVTGAGAGANGQM